MPTYRATYHAFHPARPQAASEPPTPSAGRRWLGRVRRLAAAAAPALLVLAGAVGCAADPLSPRPAVTGPRFLYEGEQPPPAPPPTLEEMITTVVAAEEAMAAGIPATPTPGGVAQHLLLDDCVQGFQFCYHLNGSPPVGNGGGGYGPACEPYWVLTTAAAAKFVQKSVAVGIAYRARDRARAGMEFLKAGAAWSGFYAAYHEWAECTAQNQPIGPVPPAMPLPGSIGFPYDPHTPLPPN